MKGTYHGFMSMDEFFQALFQDREEFFRRYNITHIRKATLYFTPTDEHGQPLSIVDRHGNPVDGYVSAGAYRSAADAYDKALHKEPDHETRAVIRQRAPTNVPFSPL
ncbi:MAG TPA: hypothetical protein VF982_01670 [Anaerolineales bacterium]|jgi:hypothetical protein